MAAAPDEVFDRYAQRVHDLLGVPAALVSLVSVDGQVLPGAVGLPGRWADERATPLTHSFCQHVVTRTQPLVIPDARRDPLLGLNGAVEDLDVIAYAGIPLRDDRGAVLGALCALDSKPREWNEQDLTTLNELAGECARELQQRLRIAPDLPAPAPDLLGAVGHRELFRGLPTAYLVLSPELVIVEVNDAYLEISGRRRDELVGRPVFEAFPPTSDAIDAQGRNTLRLSFERARDTGRPDVLPLYSYGVADPDTGEVVHRHWSLVNAPLLAADGRTLLVLQRVQDVTDYVASRSARDRRPIKQRVQAVEADLYATVQELRAVQQAQERSTQRLAALSAAALALNDADDLSAFGDIVVRGLVAAGCDGGAVSVIDAEDPESLVVVSNSYQSERVAMRLPLTGSRPASVTARTGRTVLLPDREAALAYSPETAQVLASIRSQAFASLPLRAGGPVLGVLTAGWSEPHAFPAEETDLLQAFAAQCAQAVDRLRTRRAERAASRAVAALAEVSMALTEATTVGGLIGLVLDRGVAALGAQGGAVSLLRDDAVEVIMTPSLGDAARQEYATLPLDSPLPAAVATTTGRSVVLADRAACLGYGHGMAEVIVSTGCEAWIAVPMVFQEDVRGALVLGWSAPQSFTRTQFELLEGFAAQCAQAVARMRARDDERASAARAAAMAHALQRSLLTAPSVPDDLDVAVRYRPAAVDVQVGGDWYDAFVTPADTTTLVVGDVSGHDQQAAAAMAQVRNLLRGIAHVIPEPPAAVLRRLDQTIHSLQIGTFATAVLATLERRPAVGSPYTLRWSSAGHLPPVLARPDGRVELLRTRPELLLGVDAGTSRTDHAVELPAGSVLLLYTDGLVERRDGDIDAALEWLRTTVADLIASATDEPIDTGRLCDALLAAVRDFDEDDIVLLAVRVLA